VYLDMRHVTGIDLPKRFPGISAFLARQGLELSRDRIPVRPAAHYLMGGVRADVDGRTSLPRLFAAGEVACTGVHGANRLASNSLLEGLVFGARAASAMQETKDVGQGGKRPRQYAKRGIADLAGRQKGLQQRMWRDAGLLRDAEGLTAMRRELDRLRVDPPGDRASLEFANLHAVADLIVMSALAREESRGAHFRNDFPKRDDARFRKHSLARNGSVSFQEAPQPALAR
jgi:L-aspartate oxidase